MKKTNKIIIILFIISLCIPLISYAFNMPTNMDKQNTEFFSVEKEKASPGETISMYINLDNIKYEEYIFTLNSNTSLNNISSENIETNIKENVLTIQGNTQELTLQKIELYYQIPENVEVGTKIKLIAQIQQNTEMINEDEKTQNEVKTEKVEQEINDSQNKIEEITIYIDIVENSDNTENIGNTENVEIEENQNIKNPSENMQQTIDISNNSMEFVSNNVEQNNSVISETEITQITGVSSNLETTQTETYEGESNNYLKSLNIEGYEFISDFSKTSMTYFLDIENEITSLDISAETEDENATINIYGNENLKEGTNKILISVTAENGDVKMYRIFVTKNS